MQSKTSINDWFNFVSVNGDVRAGHTTIYMYLLHLAIQMNTNTFEVDQMLAMKMCGIKSHNTFNMYVRNLVGWGFITYKRKRKGVYTYTIKRLNKEVPIFDVMKSKAVVKKRVGKPKAPLLFPIEDPYPFDAFWNLYDYKVGKKPCKRKWANLPKKSKQEIMDILPTFIERTCVGKDERGKTFRPHPSTFLNQERWKDEMLIENKTPNYVKI